MEAFLEEFQHLNHFNLKEIMSITGAFDKKNLIGRGGFGKVYRGVVSDSKGQIQAAFKRLDSNCGQGNPEFLKEIILLSRYTHENLISLLGFCDEDGEKILVYEHAAHGSLDAHLSSSTLTWTQRLKICLGAAKGLCYLHDPRETQQRVIHRDIKSSNILLDENWNAKVSDMGLSKIGPANQVNSFLATNVAGTFCYIDPLYMETSILTKESDVYSFGVVLFEVLCGSLCFENNNGRLQSFVRRWRKSYKEKKLEEIIFPHMKQHMDVRSLETFSEIAYRCLQMSRAERPSMSHVVEKLENALHFQEEISKMNPVNLEELSILLSERCIHKEISDEDMVESVVNKEGLEIFLSERFLNKEEQKLFMSKGILVNGGNTWFSLNKNGEQCEMISGDCCDFVSTMSFCYHTGFSNVDGNKSRFKARKQKLLYTGFKTRAGVQFSSPGITYKVNLVFKLERSMKKYKYLKYKFAGEIEFSTSFISHEREDGWMMTDPLCLFIYDTDNVDLDITFDCKAPVLIEGILIQSMDRVKHVEELEEVDAHPDTYWETKLPNDWRNILRSSKDILQWRTKKELYSIFRKGFLINNGKEWCSLANNGKICHIRPARKEDVQIPQVKHVEELEEVDAHPDTYWETKLPNDWRNILRSSKDILQWRTKKELYSIFCKGFLINNGKEWCSLANNGKICHIRPARKEDVQIPQVQHVEELEEVDTDTYWEQKLPNDWRNILKSSKDILQWRTNKELYSIFCKGFLINNGEEWFSLANNGKICHMLSARKAASYLKCDWKYLPDSRFRETACDPYGRFHMNCKSIMLSPQTAYVAYIVYKLKENYSHFESPVEVYMTDIGEDSIGCYIYLLSREPPLIRGKVYQKKRVPQKRNDGWMEVPVWEFQTDIDTTSRNITVEFQFKRSFNVSFNGLIVEGIEFRPT